MGDEAIVEVISQHLQATDVINETALARELLTALRSKNWLVFNTDGCDVFKGWVDITQEEGQWYMVPVPVETEEG